MGTKKWPLLSKTPNTYVHSIEKARNEDEIKIKGEKFVCLYTVLVGG